MKNIIAFIIFIIFMHFAAGAQQYSYLGSYNTIGVPSYLTTRDTITSGLLARVSASLPESYPVPTYNPQYITTGTQTDIILKDSADVWVTFVGEGAGYKNVLGFYTYDKNSPPTSAPSGTDITIIFPNVSANGSGGGLYVGDKVKLGTFSKNTGIGWVLFANGFNNGTVTSGSWVLFSNPDFNPENDTTLRRHNVLLNDTSENVVILGFEDIRRDYNSCDNDFNDALFYVTSNPVTAIDTTGINPTTPAGQGVSSGYSGGLESHSGLSGLVGLRNINRAKDNLRVDALYIESNTLQKYLGDNASRALAKGTAGLNIPDYVPERLIASNSSYISTPSDLIDITTAKQVWAVDYLADKKTIAAVLGTITDGGVYDHTKVICDRLKGAELKDVCLKSIKGYDFIRSCIIRPSGKVEYAISFSLIPDGHNNYKLESLWNLSEYGKADDVINIQVWSQSPAYTVEIISSFINKFSEEHNLFQETDPKLPSLYIAKAGYKNGAIHMVVHNLDNVQKASFSGQISESETGVSQPVTENFELTGAIDEKIILNTGYMFDAGFRIDAEGKQADYIYQADGQWGLDYVKENVTVNSFVVDKHTELCDDECYVIERPVRLRAETDDYISIYRFLKPDGQPVDVSQYKSIEIDFSGNDLKLMMMVDGMSWQDYPKVQISSEDRYISLDGFGDYDATKVTGFIFTPVQNDESVDLDINRLALSINTVEKKVVAINTSIVYPNPAKEVLYIKDGMNGEGYTITDIYGRVRQKGVYSKAGINVRGLQHGVFFLKRKGSTAETNSKFIIAN